MADRLRCEFALVRYVPDVVKGEFTNIGVILRGEDGTQAVRFTRDWSRVRCLDTGADVGLLESLEAEVAERLSRDGAAGEKPLLAMLQESLSNSVQLSDMRGALAESLTTEMEQLMRMYVESLQPPAARRPLSGRTAIAAEMRLHFERAGVWRLMRKRIRAAEFTQTGDPTRIDCGYRVGAAKMFQAVSLENEVEGAKSLAYTARALREGVRRVEALDLELTAVVETIATVSDEESYRFGMRAMQREAIRVMTVADLGRIAETARRDLRV